MGGVAFVFPGQGAQQPGMGLALYEGSSGARELMDRAEKRMPGLLDACFHGPMERLTRTDIAQPALFMLESALAQAAAQAGIRPRAAAGFSMGEWTACHAAGMLPFDQGFALVRQRGEWMQARAQESPGGMAAVLRLNAGQLRESLRGHPEIHAVNFNAPGQTVVAGPLSALEEYEKTLRARGGRSIRLKVAGAFHSPMMEAVSERMLAALAEERIMPPAFPVYSNLTALPYQADTAGDWLAAQLSRPVMWEASIRRMAGQGIDTFLELGPGKVLSGLIAGILPGARTLQAEDMAGIREAAERLGGMA